MLAAFKDALKESPFAPVMGWGSRLKRTKQYRDTLTAGRIFQPDEIDAAVSDYRAVCLDTMLGTAAILNLELAARYVTERNIGGAVVECGVWRGGSISYLARTFARLGEQRHIWAFDSFEGLPRPTGEDGETVIAHDASLRGASNANGALVGGPWCRAPEYRCAELLAASGQQPEYVHIRKGWFQDTLHTAVEEIGPIAILRLDGDLYESTKVALENLFPLLIQGGWLIVDDYGWFPGCRAAMSEFFAAQDLAALHHVDVGARFLIRAH